MMRYGPLENFSSLFFDKTSGKTERRWIIPAPESQVLAEHLMQKFEWPEARAVHELDQVLTQVWHLYLQARGDVPPAAIWSEFVFLLLGQQIDKYRPWEPLSPYVTRIVGRGLAHLIGGGPAIGSQVKDPKVRLRQRIAVATLGINLNGTIEDNDGHELSEEMVPMDCGPISRQLVEEQRKEDAERIAIKRSFFPLVDLRLAGRPIRDYPAYREQIRRAANPARAFVPLDAERTLIWATKVAAKKGAGPAMRAKTTVACARLYRSATGESMSREMLAIFTELAVSWQGGPRAATQDGRFTKVRRRIERLNLKW